MSIDVVFENVLDYLYGLNSIIVGMILSKLYKTILVWHVEFNNFEIWGINAICVALYDCIVISVYFFERNTIYRWCCVSF